MNKKYIFGGVVIVVFLGIMFFYFTKTNISYEHNFQAIKSTNKTVKATGVWVKEKSYEEDIKNRTFTFYIKDAFNTELKVVYKGTKPNNFEIASSVVVTGKYIDNVFYATDVLTKCPSKYEKQMVKSSGM